MRAGARREEERAEIQERAPQFGFFDKQVSRVPKIPPLVKLQLPAGCAAISCGPSGMFATKPAGTGSPHPLTA